jgi:pantothenate kinase
MEAECVRLTDTISEKALLHHKKRYIVAIAGAPGSGKTTIARTVVSKLNKLPPNPHHAAVLSMDGFHLPRSILDNLPNREEAYVRRGAPWTFDAVAFVQFMRRLRAWADTKPSSSSSSGDRICAPSFDHKTKDPVENGIVIEDDVSIVIVEGNYVLLDEDGWRDVASLVDYRVFVDVDLQEARERLAKRHVAAGIEITLEDAFRRVDANDYLNGVMIKEHLVRPDLVVKSLSDTAI